MPKPWWLISDPLTSNTEICRFVKRRSAIDPLPLDEMLSHRFRIEPRQFAVPVDDSASGIRIDVPRATLTVSFLLLLPLCVPRREGCNDLGHTSAWHV